MMRNAIILLAITACVLLAGCDTAVDDGKVPVRYEIAAEKGAVVEVAYLDENQEYQRVYAGDGWKYDFRVEEGAQLLYIVTLGVTKGSAEARIYVEGERVRSYVHPAAKSTEEVRMGSSVWGRNEDIELTYLVQAYNSASTELNMPAGKETYSDASIAKVITVDPGFDASVHVTRGSIESGFSCIRVLVFYEAVEGEDPLLLLWAYQCDVAPIDLTLSLPVPGYQ